MITALDSSVILDVIARDTTFGARSLEAIRAASRVGTLVACSVVWAEVRSAFEQPHVMDDAFAAAGIEHDALDRTCADLAGQLWREYRGRGGTRPRLVADFLIGAHAHVRGARLLTRDRGFYRAYFSSLQIIDPTA